MKIKLILVCFLMIVFIFLQSCATQLPIKRKYEEMTMNSNSPGYSTRQSSLKELDSLHFPTIAYRNTMEKKIYSLFESAIQVSFYLSDLDNVQDENITKQNVYSWINGIVAGLGALLATIDESRDWGPIAGGIGAGWALIGLSFQKVSVDPAIDKASLYLQIGLEISNLINNLNDKWVKVIQIQSEWEEIFNNITTLNDNDKKRYNEKIIKINTVYDDWIDAANKILQKRGKILNIDYLQR